MQTHSARILPFRRAQPAVSAKTIADVLLALEGSPLFAPTVVVARTLFHTHQINVVVDGGGHVLNPAEARLAARVLQDDPGQPGGLEVAARLIAAAAQAERMSLRGVA